MKAAEWNIQYPVDQPIALTEDDGSVTYTQTRSIAWDLNGDTTVVKVDGKTGGYDLSRIEAR